MNDNEHIEESEELLYSYRQQFVSKMEYYVKRIDHLDEVMKRKAAKKWAPKKKKKMVRRLLDARAMVKQLEPIINQIQVRIDQITIT